MGTTRLQIYNGALQICKERSLTSLTENSKALRELDQVWNDGGIDYCLEQGQWYFAMRSIQLGYDPDEDPQFGYVYAFSKPDDWILTSGLCSDERFTTALTDYVDEAGFWRADITPLYIKYVSNDDAFGNNLGIWPSSFTEFVQAYFASKVVLNLSGAGKLAEAIMGTGGDERNGILYHRKLVAKSRAAMTQGTTYPATGSWVRARVGARKRGPMGDGGTGGALTG